MKRFGGALALAIAAVGAAHAADLPTTKEVPPPAVNCFASFWTWLDSTPADCPVSYAGFTVFGTLDWGMGYEFNGADYNAAYTNNVANIITKQSNGAKWVQTPNGLGQSVVGVNMKEPIGHGWSLIGTWEMGFNPYYGYLADAERSMVQNNGKALSSSEREWRFEPHRAMGQRARVHRRQQQDLRHADRRPREYAVA